MGVYAPYINTFLEACVGAMRLPGGELDFNLTLHDPIAEYLPEVSPWRGLAGEYVLHLGSESCVEKGHVSGLPLLSATVGAFTRLWLGVATPTGLAVTDHLSAPPELLEDLDRLLCLPSPHIDWDL